LFTLWMCRLAPSQRLHEEYHLPLLGLFTRAKVERRRAQLDESVARYLSQLDTADRQEPSEALAAKVTRLTEKLTKLKEEMGKLAVYESRCSLRPTSKSR